MLNAASSGARTATVTTKALGVWVLGMAEMVHVGHVMDGGSSPFDQAGGDTGWSLRARGGRGRTGPGPELTPGLGPDTSPSRRNW